MAITLITGVPGTGKTAFVVAELEKIAATGRTIFVDNIPGLKLPHYRAGRISEWQKGTWFHIDVYKRTAPAVVMGAGKNLEADYDDEIEDDNDGDENWMPHPEVVKLADCDELRRLAHNEHGEVVGSVPYESHKGALLVIDEAQRHFRPRSAGSPVPDHVAALEVHRKQCDIWIITQRPNLIDSNVRGLVGKHIALRDTFLGRYKYEWPEVGDIESKTSRDVAAKSKYKLPKHVFNLYKSAEVHTVHKHTFPMAAKILLLVVPLALVLIFTSYKTISGKFNPVSEAIAEPVKQQSTGSIQRANANVETLNNIERYTPPMVIAGRHPHDQHQLAIVGRLYSSTKDIYRFSVSQNGQHLFYTSSTDMVKAGYSIQSINDCSAKVTYNRHEFFTNCAAVQSVQVDYNRPAPMQPVPMKFNNLESYP